MEKNPPPEKAAEAGTAETLQLSVMYIKDGEPTFLLVPLTEKENVGVVASRAKKLAGIPKKSKARLVCQGVVIEPGRPVLAENDAWIINGKCAWQLVEEEPSK